MAVFSDLDLNPPTPKRVQPRRGRPARGVWAPVMVPTTGQKRFTRVAAVLSFCTVLAVLLWVGHFFYQTVQLL